MNNLDVNALIANNFLTLIQLKEYFLNINDTAVLIAHQLQLKLLIKCSRKIELRLPVKAMNLVVNS